MRSFAEQSCRGVDTAFSDCSSSWRSRRWRFERAVSLEAIDVYVPSRFVGVDSEARAGRGEEQCCRTDRWESGYKTRYETSLVGCADYRSAFDRT